jgi:uncharacterized protein (TIGR00255 family)
MMKSMTGYGKAECELPNKKITIEVKSLNSKQLDINTRMPGLYKEKDISIRKLISDILGRGKVEFSMYLESLGEESNATINSAVVRDYFQQLNSVRKELGIDDSQSLLDIVMRLPDTVKVEREELDEEEWKQIRAKVKEALLHLDEFRIQEGDALYKDIEANVQMIQNLLPEVAPFEKERLDKVKERIKDNLKELEASDSVDNNRFEQEMIYYLEKLDINEEKVRLANHCTYFLETMKLNEPVGKKLGFIAQEIGREINTMGSKANHADIQKIVIQMKDALERVKEQTLNVL